MHSNTELAAVYVFLDEIHGLPKERFLKDCNKNYTLGRIGKHNLVIAVLPINYRRIDADWVGRDMLRSFPGVKIMLMVDIDSGMLSARRNDIQFGDVVVSAPMGRECDASQFGCGKTTQALNLSRTQSPNVLHVAISKLEAQYKSLKHQLHETISILLELEKNRRLWRWYKRPESNEDNPDDWEIVHPMSGKIFGTSCYSLRCYCSSESVGDRSVEVNAPYLSISGSCKYREGGNEENE